MMLNTIIIVMNVELNMVEIVKLYNQEKIEMLLERLVRAIEELNRTQRCN